MATYKQGVNGAFSGKAGSVVGSNWRSIGYLRGLSRFKNKSNSPKQAAQRMRFGMAVSFLQPMKSLLRIGFNDRARGRNTGFNQGLRRFVNQAVVGEYPDLQIDYSQVSLSRGALEKLIGLSAVSDTPNMVAIHWANLHDPASESAFADDQLIVVLYNRTEDIFTSNRSAVRQDETLQLELPSAFVGHEFHIWVFARHREGVEVSTSQYAGTVVLA
ncbi:DUF6266 family protein [Parapedobacter tibetensis]|uniref:DUF6266 family protein n=1 Tax=Parapedobacter tibetensis TaxID=2972951 RepID=UPI00214DD3E6|nr:DUF6266 family protein [Parapedobacter tibetensis]